MDAMRSRTPALQQDSRLPRLWRLRPRPSHAPTYRSTKVGGAPERPPPADCSIRAARRPLEPRVRYRDGHLQINTTEGRKDGGQDRRARDLTTPGRGHEWRGRSHRRPRARGQWRGHSALARCARPRWHAAVAVAVSRKLCTLGQTGATQPVLRRHPRFPRGLDLENLDRTTGGVFEWPPPRRNDE